MSLVEQGQRKRGATEKPSKMLDVPLAPNPGKKARATQRRDQRCQPASTGPALGVWSVHLVALWLSDLSTVMPALAGLLQSTEETGGKDGRCVHT